MDTISRENSPSILPIAGVIVGALALVLAAVALVKLAEVKKLKADVESANSRVESMAGDVRQAVEKADRASSSLNNLATQTQRGFDAVTAEIGNLRTDVNKLATAPKAAPAKAPKEGKDGAAPVKDGAAPEKAGPGGDYTVKAGDGLARIAKAHGVTLAAMQAANPGVDSSKLKVGQKINLPK
jgi:LysM repeat protein